MKKTIMYMIFVIIVCSFALGQTYQYCGDGICNNGETETTCETDCRCIPETITIEVPIVTLIPAENPLPVDFYYRKLELVNTCGVDGDLDGLICDPNENYLNCKSDCPAPSLDSLLCINEQNCSWNQAWFVKVAFLGMLVLGAVLIIQGSRTRRR